MRKFRVLLAEIAREEVRAQVAAAVAARMAQADQKGWRRFLARVRSLLARRGSDTDRGNLQAVEQMRALAAAQHAKYGGPPMKD